LLDDIGHHHKDAFLHSTKKDKPDYQMFACQDSENTSKAYVNDQTILKEKENWKL
jgi:heat shock protein HspQ